jgi:hypothetical protein
MTDKRAKHDTRSYAGMTAEYHETDAPAPSGDKDAECKQQSASARSAKNECRGEPRDLPNISRC